MIWAYGDKPLHLMQWFHFFLYWVSVWLLVCITFLFIYYYYYYFDGCFVWNTIWVKWRECDDLTILLMIKGWTKDTLNPKLMKFIPHHICSLFMNEIHHAHTYKFSSIRVCTHWNKVVCTHAIYKPHYNKEIYWSNACMILDLITRQFFFIKRQTPGGNFFFPRWENIAPPPSCTRLP